MMTVSVVATHRNKSGYQFVNAALAVLILIQAVVAGQALFGEWDIEIHGWMGNASFMLAVGSAVLALWTRATRGALVISIALVLAMFAQTGLGYIGRTTATAASLHVPLGVLIFGLAALNAAVPYMQSYPNTHQSQAPAPHPARGKSRGNETQPPGD